MYGKDDCKEVKPPLTVQFDSVQEGTTGWKLKFKEIAPDSL